jgi:hypothetical protein
MDQLRKEGVPEANVRSAAAELVGQAISESSLNPKATHDNGTGYGIYGARLDRRDKMFNWLGQHGFTKDSLEGQMRYMAHEAMTETKYRPTREALMNATPGNILGQTARVTGNFESPAIINDRRGAVSNAYRSGPAENPGGDKTGSAIPKAAPLPVGPKPKHVWTDAEWSNFSKRLQASGMGTPEGKRSQTPYQGDPTDPAFDKDKWLPYKKTPWSPGLHAIDPHKEQEASLHGDLLGAAHKAGMFSHKVTGEATVRVALDQGLVGKSTKSKGGLFKQIALNRAPTPVSSMES